MIRSGILALTGFLLLSYAEAGSIKVSYLSLENVYVNGGTADSITAGMILEVKRKDKIIARIEVIYAAEHSASCKILEKEDEIKPGDTINIVQQKTAVDSSSATGILINLTKTSSENVRSGYPARTIPDIKGYLAFQWYHFQDGSESRYHFDQPAIRFKLKARQLWHRFMNLEIKMRSRHNERFNRSSKALPESEWRHRLYTAALSYDNPESGLGVYTGRISSGFISGTGYIDGIQLQYMVNKFWQTGLFAGFQPQWDTSSFQYQRKKYGAFVRYKTQNVSSWRTQISLSAVGEYHDAIVSREFLYMQGFLSMPGDWQFYHSFEIDVNRQWRHERTGNNLTLSSLYISGSKQINPRINIQMTYDNRQNYYTYEYYSLSDSLFDDAFRQGLRLYLNINIYENLRISLNSGIRKREDQSQTTYSHGIRAMIPHLILTRLSTSGRLSLFTNLYSKGITYNLNLSKRILQGHEIGFDLGSQQYQFLLDHKRYNNHYLRLQTTLALPFNLNLYSYYEFDTGDDLKGQNVYVELGYYF